MSKNIELLKGRKHIVLLAGTGGRYYSRTEVQTPPFMRPKVAL